MEVRDGSAIPKVLVDPLEGNELLGLLSGDILVHHTTKELLRGARHKERHDVRRDFRHGNKLVEQTGGTTRSGLGGRTIKSQQQNLSTP
jgi:hypothetical protein